MYTNINYLEIMYWGQSTG